jgi:GSH-dependent disulfide-bond oxidoreductase
MLQFHYHPSPNPAKVALFLEEAGLPYEVVPVDIRKGEQHHADYLKLNPNGKTPTLVDGDAVVFDSNAILLYLAVKNGKFLPRNEPAIRAQMYSWLMFIATGLGPFSGQAVHFGHFAPAPQVYALNRYDFEAWRHWRLIEQRLAGRTHMVGDEYTIVDMALWGWAGAVPYVLGPDAFDKLPNVRRFLDRMNERPAAQRATALASAHAYKPDMDQQAMDAMYPQNRRLA